MALSSIINNINVGRSAAGSAVNLLSGLLGEGADGGQQKFSVSKLNASMQKSGGLVQPTLFLAQIQSPPALGGGADDRPQNFLCNSANLPGKNIIVQEHKRFGYGSPDRRVTSATFPEITLTFFVSNDGEPLQYFNEWLENIFYTNVSGGGNAISASTGVPVFTVRYRTEYTVQMEIAVFNVAQQQVMKYTLYEAFPMQIGDVTVEWGANDSFATVAVVFTYRYYQMNSVAVSTPGSGGGILSSIRNGLGVVNRLMTSAPARAVLDGLNIAEGNKLF